MHFPFHTFQRLNYLQGEKEVQLLGSVQCVSFIWIPDFDLCVITVTAGQAEITAS